MKRYSKFLLVGVAVLALAMLMVPAMAQENLEDVGPSEGGVIVEGNIGGDPATFNALLSNDTVSSAVTGRLFPVNIGTASDTFTMEPLLDPETGERNIYVQGALAESYSFDETGTILTVTLRQDAFWSDGVQITADDWIWSYDAVRSGLTSSPRTYVFATLADGTNSGGPVVAYEKIDDFTIQITLGDATFDEEGNVTEVTPNCAALADVNDVSVVPAHIFSEAFGTDYAAMDDDPFFVPEGTFGTWQDHFFEAGVQVSLLANPDYTDGPAGFVRPSEWVLENVGDQTIEYQRFLDGDFTTIGIPADRQNEFRTLAEEEGYQILEYPANGYTYMGYNTADPENPQPGLDEDGNPIDQGLHPIFGDPAVRRALAYAVDVREIIGTGPDGDNPATGILEGNGFPQAVHNHPSLSPVEAPFEPYPFEPETALELLAEAGWTDANGDGTLECTGCLYATEVDPTFEGSPFEFELLTNAGNTIRERTGQTIREQLGEIGITVNFEAIDFGTLVDVLTGQAFDAIIIGWNLGLPFDPEGSSFFGPENDLPGAGFAFTSYYNERLNELWAEATTLPGCDWAERAPLYQEAMQILYDDQPYMWLFAGNVMAAAQPWVEGWDPLPNATTWNQDAWSVLEQ